MYLKTSIALTLALSTAAAASEREHDSHEHGVATLDVVIDGNAMLATLESPWANLVGFEHKPSTDEQRDAVAKAKALLEDGMLALGIDDAAGCTLQSAELNSSMAMDAHDEHGHDDEHDQDHGDESPHSKVSVNWAFSCENPDAMSALTPTLFDNFEGIETLSVQMAGPGGQSAQESTMGSATVNLSAVQ